MVHSIKGSDFIETLHTTLFVPPPTLIKPIKNYRAVGPEDTYSFPGTVVSPVSRRSFYPRGGTPVTREVGGR